MLDEDVTQPAPAESADLDWRAAFGAPRPSAGPEPRPASTYTQLALQFELRQLIPRTAHQWNGPTSRAVTASASESAPGVGPDAQWRLGVRPVVRTARSWARRGLTWSNITHLLNRLNLDPEQYRWCCQFGALHRAAGALAPGADADWVFLDEFVNDVLWALLDQARTLGIPLVGAGAGAGGRVHLAERARLGLDLARVTDPADDAQGGARDALVVTPLLDVDDAPMRAMFAHPIGTHGIYVVDPKAPRDIVLARLDEPLTPARLGILRGGHAGRSRAARSGLTGAPITVPADGVEEFLRDYLPALREHVDVASHDHSVVLPAPAAPLLVLTATFQPRNVLELEWQWAESRHAGVPLPILAEVLRGGLVPKQWTPAIGPGATPLPASLVEADAADFVAKVLPQLRALPGVRVDVVGTQPDYRELTGTPVLTVQTLPTERTDWFDLGVTLTVDGRTIPFVPLFKALAKGSTRLMLVDKSYFSLKHPAFAPLRDLIEEADGLTEWQTGPRISRYQTSLWADFEDLADQATPAVEWRALLSDVAGDAPRPIDPPQALTATLRPYQADGFAWLSFLWRHRLGGILADDMGLGKTLQCLALVQRIAEARAESAERHPFLVVAPTSVVSNWVAEAAKFAPGLAVRSVTVTQAKQAESIAELAAGADIVVTSYALLRLDFDAYQAVATSSGWSGLILDEAQFVKNATSRVHECARDISIPFKLAVTGTPMENSLTELHALFAIVAPGLFPSARRFAEEYVRPIEQPNEGVQRGAGAGTGPAVTAEIRDTRLARLRRRMHPFLLRRTKELVATELPAKHEQVLRIDLAPDHRALYDVFLQRERRKLFGLLTDMDRNRFIVFRSLTLLRLLALDAALLGDEYAGVASSKLDALMEQLDDVLAEGHRALIFSQFTSYLEVVAARLAAAGIHYALLDGGTRNRDAVIEEFRGGAAPVFLISLKAGGFGLNLTEADYVFLLDPWWNPASEAQAIDRTHRIGQTKNVMVYRLVAADTIEDKVMALKARKAALFDAVVDDDELFSSLLSADDVRALLA